MRPRTIKHFSLHRIEDTELRVISDVENGVLPVVQVEERVIQGYIHQKLWPHREVTLFILQDMQPIVRQLGPNTAMPPGGAAALDTRPVVNIYDLANPAACHVVVNKKAMEKEGYWHDPMAMQGLLAHEHAHPLAENQTTRSSRSWQVHVTLAQATSEGQAGRALWTANRHDKVQRLIAVLADKLCLYAPREIFANDLMIQKGFGQALLHLDRGNVLNAGRSVEGRSVLQQQLQADVARDNLTVQGADVLLLIADLKGYLDLALEIAPFYRAGQQDAAKELESVLQAAVFPNLATEVAVAYADLCEQYRLLRPDLATAEMQVWGHGVLTVLARALAQKGMALHDKWIARVDCE